MLKSCCILGSYTSLHFMVQAASKWDTEGKGVKFFLSEKLNLESADKEGKTPLTLAVTQNLFEVSKKLVSNCKTFLITMIPLIREDQ